MGMDIVIPKFKRRQFLVAKKFQLKYVGIMLFFMFLTAAMCSYVVYYTTTLLMGEKLARVYLHSRFVHIAKIVNFRILLSLIFVTPIVVLMGILLSHKIAGPIYRMEKFLNSMAGGNFSSQLFLRKGDELMIIANGINNLSESLRSAITSQKGILDKMSASINSIMKMHPSDEAAVNLERQMRDLKAALDRFSV